MSKISAKVLDSLSDYLKPADDGMARYRDDPVGFFRDILGQKTWPKQEEILRATAQTPWVTVRSGHRVSKTNSAAGLALWFVQTRGPASRVVLTGPSSQILKEGLWRAVRQAHQACRAKVGGHAGLLANTGINWPDMRQIIGITADDAEGFQGLAAPEIMFIADEASGIHERLFEAMMGNLAGGGRMMLIGNPLRTQGFFYESHKSRDFAKIHISSHDSPNITEADPSKHIKGLATQDWLDRCARMWGGENGVMYRIKCKGEFVEAREGRMISPDMICAAELRWSEIEPTGRLVIGLDPAGEGGDGDASGFVCRRGMKVVHMDTRRGLTPEAHLVELLGLIQAHKGDSFEKALVVVDRDGLVGHKVYTAILKHLLSHEGQFEMKGIRGSEHAKRRPLEIDNVRDELWFALADAFTAGLAIPPSTELSGDLAAVRFDKLVNGRAKVLPKKTIRRELGRSPDLGDALCLACYVEMGNEVDANAGAAPPPPQMAQRVHEHRASRLFDPYAALNVWKR